MKNIVIKMSPIILLLVLVIVPVFLNERFLHMLILIILFAFLAQCWNLMSGFTGQFSFGHAAFFGIGAYTSTILLTKYGISPWIGMFVGFGISFLFGLFIGNLSFRYKLRGVYFGLATLAFAEILRIIIENSSYFNSTVGIFIPLDRRWTMFQFESRITYFYIILVVLLLFTWFIHYIVNSKFGYLLVSIRENEEAAQSLGVNVFKNKLLAVGLSAGFSAIGGTFYAQYILFIKPASLFSVNMSVEILLPAIIGGVGTVFGPIVGAFIVTFINEITKMLFSDLIGLNLILYGVILILVILYLPDGIVGRLKKLRRENK